MDCKIGLLFLVFGLSTVLAQNRCREGDCVPFQNCLKLVDEINKSPRNVASYEILRKRTCGFDGRDPRICCTYQEQNYAPRPPRNATSHGNDSNTSNSNNLLPNECGQDFSNRIIGGNLTEPGEFPWMAILEYETPGGQTIACGGSLINNRYILTAAHCVREKDLPQKWVLKSVRLGEYNTATNPDCIPDGEESICNPPPISVPVAEKIIHSNYGKTYNQHNDIALLRLAYKVQFTSTIKPICLPDSASLDKKFVVSGWGLTEDEVYSEIKLKVVVPLVDANSCKSTYMTIKPNPRQLISSQICAGGEKGKDSCRGDSGGPLMQRVNMSSGGAKWLIAGVTSFGPTPCGLGGWPGVYTNVFYFRSWIISKLKP